MLNETLNETAPPASTPPYKGGAASGGSPRKPRPPDAPTSHMAARGLVIATLPKGLEYITRRLKVLRDLWEAEITERTGKPPTDADLRTLQQALGWQQHAEIAQRGLRKLELTPDLHLRYSRAIPVAFAERDRCLLVLNINPNVGAGASPSITLAPALDGDDE